MYLISLEALKKACIKGYAALIGYDDSESTVNSFGSRNHLITQLESKKDDLLNFATSKSISEADIKMVSKGKWYLYGFAYFTYQVLAKLKDDCRSGVINQCPSCKSGNFNDCLFKLKQPSYRPELLRDILLESFDFNELADIAQAINALD